MKDNKKRSKMMPPPEWLEIPRVTRGVTIPTSSGLRSGLEVELAIGESETKKETLPTREECDYKAEGLDASKMTVAMEKHRKPAVKETKDSKELPEPTPPEGDAWSEDRMPSKESPTSTPSSPPEWLELPKLPQPPAGQSVAVPEVVKDTSEEVTSPASAPSRPSDVPAEAEGPPKCPHCGAILTKAQLELKATGTKALCSECFNMV